MNRSKVLLVTVTVAIGSSGLFSAAAGAQKSRPTSHVVGKPGGYTLSLDHPAPGPVAITGARLLTVTHGTIENGTIVLAGGKIAAVGGPGTAVPKGAQVIDGKGMTVYPGLVDAETTLGLVEVEADRASNDLAETSDEIMPHMHVADAFHAESARIPVARLNGVTNAIVAPASEDSIAGQDSFIQLYGRDRDEMILARDVALAMNASGEQRRTGRGGFGQPGGPPKYPSTRMGIVSQIRQSLLDAQNYMEAREKANDKKPPEKRDLKLEALIPYLKGEKPVVLGAHEAYEVEVAMELAREFKLKVILDHVEHSQEVLDKIAAYHVPVIVGPIYTAPAANERYDAVYSLPAELQKRGVKIALASFSTQYTRNLPYAAGYAVAYGLPYDEALKAITLNPAEMFGMGDQLGSLDVGKMANVVLANGDPLDVQTDVKQVYIQGIAVPMESRQTKLRDQYTRK